MTVSGGRAPLLAQISTRYDLSWHVLSGGGAPRSSENYQIDDVLGQQTIVFT